MSAAGLESLTNELFEQVVQHLSLEDVRNLRLVSRSTAFKAAQDTYESFFREKHVDLRRGHLQSFVKATSKNGVGCHVEHLSLIGTVYNPKELQTSIENGSPPRKMGSSRKVTPPYTAKQVEAAKQDLAMLRRRRKEDTALQQEGADVILLREAFSNIALRKTATLKLSLRIKIYLGDTVKPRPSSLWYSKQVFQVATRTFWLAMESLRSSQLRVQALDIFYNLPEQLEAILPCDILGNLDLTTTGGLGPCLSNLKILSLSITDPLVHETKYDTRHNIMEGEDAAIFSDVDRYSAEATLSEDRITDEMNYTALAKILQLAPSLEELNITGFPLDCLDAELARLQKTMRSRHMHHLARAPALLQLRKLCLANLETRDTDLPTFLGSHISSLRELELTDIRIPGGSFPSLVSYITGEETRLVAIRFENIREGRDLVHFHCDWERERVKWEDRDVVRRWGLKRKGDIDYFGRGLSLMGSPKVWEWTLEEKVREEEEEEEDV